MKKISLILLPIFILILGFAGCDKDENNSSQETNLQGTKWKLAGFVDESGKLTDLEPKDCEKCYTLTFETDSTATGCSVANIIRAYLKPVPLIGVATMVYDDMIGDASLFYEIISLIESYSLEKDELKFYYNGNKNYLLFQPATFHECGTLNVNDDSFVTMQVIPEKVSINTDNIRLIINNHTKEDIIYGTEFSLDYFDGQTWISVNLDILFEDIGYILESNESREEALYLFPKYCTERGKYRIKKHLTLTDNSTKRKEYVICAEFEVY